jgi:hypothetical protein
MMDFISMYQSISMSGFFFKYNIDLLQWSAFAAGKLQLTVRQHQNLLREKVALELQKKKKKKIFKKDGNV